MVTKEKHGFDEGIHLYIEIGNFDNLVKHDHSSLDTIKHTLHFLQFFVAGITSFIQRFNEGESISIEKVTGSRLHLIIKCDESDILDKLFCLCAYSKLLIDGLNRTKQHATMQNANLKIGACYGLYEHYMFSSKEIENEPTSIGYCANIAAKIESVMDNNYIGVDYKIMALACLFGYEDYLQEDKSKELRKYNARVFVCSLGSIANRFATDKIKSLVEEELVKSRKATLANIDVVHQQNPNKGINNSYLNPAVFEGTIVSADVRGFSKEFDKQEINNDKARAYIKLILNTMYQECLNRHGVHVQFQGDKELLYFPKGKEQEAILYALSLSKEVQNMNYSVGIGCAYGEIYTCKIGKNSTAIGNDKDNEIIGSTLIETNKLEDEYAGKNEICINTNLFRLLPKELQGIFTLKGKYYCTNLSINSYRDYFNSHNDYVKTENPTKPWRRTL